jgi:hypothetical protein
MGKARGATSNEQDCLIDDMLADIPIKLAEGNKDVRHWKELWYAESSEAMTSLVCRSVPNKPRVHDMDGSESFDPQWKLFKEHKSSSIYRYAVKNRKGFMRNRQDRGCMQFKIRRACIRARKDQGYMLLTVKDRRPNQTHWHTIQYLRGGDIHRMTRAKWCPRSKERSDMRSRCLIG